MNQPNRKKCLKIAEKQLEKIIKTRNDIIAAYSDGSLARNDMVPGSDIDIAIIVDNQKEPWHVWRKVDKKNDVLIEWVFISKNIYKINEILGDAGFTHDIAHAYIYYDPQDFFKNVKKQVLAKYNEKKGIYKRALNQFNKIKKAIKNIETGFKNKNKELIYTNLEVIKYALGFPCAVLNSPVTNSRGFLFCQEACNKLQVPEYKNLVLNFLGSETLSKAEVQEILELTKDIIKSSKLNHKEQISYLYHLHTAQYLIDIGFWKEATWPIFMWLSYILKEILKRKGKNEIKILELWDTIIEILEWSKWKDIKNKLETGKELISLGNKILKASFKLQN